MNMIHTHRFFWINPYLGKLLFRSGMSMTYNRDLSELNLLTSIHSHVSNAFKCVNKFFDLQRNNLDLAENL